ncbi:TPA: hypothetical protein U1257_002137 [Streptococcus suis]|nr:hypothetical protein [Streptococcus suis]
MEWIRKNVKVLIIVSIPVILLGILIIFSINYQAIRWEPTEISSMTYTNIVSQLEELGFHQIELEPVKDLVRGGGTSRKTRIDITFDGETHKKSMQYFKKDANVVIRYHDYPDDLLKFNSGGLSKNSEQLAEQLQKIGFTNIVSVMEGESEIVNEENLKELTIDGGEISIGEEVSDDEEYSYPKEAKVKIVYNEPLLEVPKIDSYDSYKDYNEYVEKLKNAGFTSIEVISESAAIDLDKHLSNVTLDGKDYMRVKEQIQGKYSYSYPIKMRQSIPIVVTYKDSSEAIAKRNEEIAKQQAYEETKKNPANYQIVSYDAWIHEEIPSGTLARVTGEVVEVGEGSRTSNAYIRISMDGMFNQDVYVSIDNDYFKSNILAEGDSVTLYGSVQGRKTYTTVLGASRTIPQMSVNFYNRN